MKSPPCLATKNMSDSRERHRIPIGILLAIVCLKTARFYNFAIGFRVAVVRLYLE